MNITTIKRITRTVKFRLLQDLDFADVDVMKRIDALTDLLNILANTVGNSAAVRTPHHGCTELFTHSKQMYRHLETSTETNDSHTVTKKAGI